MMTNLFKLSSLYNLFHHISQRLFAVITDITHGHWKLLKV